jgi:hypothetical protein
MNKHNRNTTITPKPSAKNPTIRNGALNWQAPTGRESLFAALEDYANLQPGLEGLKLFQSKWPDFFPSELYEASEILESKHELSPLSWYLRQLHVVWCGADGDEARLSFLLGFYLGPNYEAAAFRDAAFQPEFDTWKAVQEELKRRNTAIRPSPIRTAAEAQRRLWRGMEGHPASVADLGFADVAPDWKLGTIRCKFNCDFQEALYALMRESWRAKSCRNCKRYFIANKPPQMYCSTKCFGEAKGKRSLAWWRAEGADRRRQRRKRIGKKAPSV